MQKNTFVQSLSRILLLCGIVELVGTGCFLNYSDYLIQQGIKCLEKDSYSAALLFKKAILLQKDNASAHYNLGVAYWKQGRKEQAIEAFRWASELVPDDPRPLEFIAWIYTEMREWEKAHNVMMEVCKSQPLNPKLLTQMARIEYHRGNIDGATAFLKEALTVDPSFPPALYNIAVVYQTSTSSTSESIKYYQQYLDAVALLSKNNIKEMDKKHIIKAQKSLDLLTNSKLPSPPAVQVTQKSNSLSSKITSPIIPYGTANNVSDRKNISDALWNLACFYKSNPEQTADAISTYKKFIEMFPEDPRCKKARKVLSELTKPPRLQKPDNILPPEQSLNESKIDKNTALKLWAEGLEYHRAGNLDMAITFYRQALKFDPECINASYNLAIAYRTKKMYNEALHMLLSTLQHKPEMVEASFLLGLVYKEIGEKEKAIKQMITTLTLDPKHVMAHYVLGRLYLEQNNPAIAMIHLETHLRLSPPDTPSAKDAAKLLAFLKQKP